VKEGLACLIERIEVYEEPRPGQRCPGARLLFRGNLEGALRLTNAKVKIGGSPGGICPRPCDHTRAPGASDQRQRALSLPSSVSRDCVPSFGNARSAALRH